MGGSIGFPDQRIFLAYLPFFINGLALFALGFYAWLDGRKPGESVFVRSLRLLAAYALVVALASWSEMTLLMQGPAMPQYMYAGLFALRTASTAVASLFLLQFATRLLSATWPKAIRWLRWLPVLLVLLWVLVLFLTGTTGSIAAWIDGTETPTRRVLYFPALLLSGIAMFNYRLSLTSPDLACRVTSVRLGVALAFGFKSLLSGLISIRPLSASAVAVAGNAEQTALIFTVEPLRTISTLLVAYFMMRLMECLERERQYQMDLAYQQRLQAQQSALEARLFSRDAIEQWSKRLDVVADVMASAIREPSGLQHALSRILSEILVWTGFQTGQVLLKPLGEGAFVLAAQRGMPRQERCAQCLVQAMEALARVPDRASVLRIPGSSGPVESLNERSGLRMLCTIPIKHGNETLGLVVLCSAAAIPLVSSDLTFLGTLGRQIGVAVEHARVHEQITSAATIEERARLSREMHDSVAQDLVSLHLRIAGLEDMAAAGNLPDAVSQLPEVVALCSKACDDVREAIMDMRFAACSCGSLISELQDYTARLAQHSDIEVTVRTEECENLMLSHGVEVQLLGIIQEALANVRRHSGATKVSLDLTCEGSTVVLTIVDNGRGFDVTNVEQRATYHFGLLTMAERAESVGGSLEISSQPGSGTRLTVRIPALV